ncbi:methyltransferase [Polyangium sp. 6x1]|uniref:methyltransferase n=1 Tax=Polyangium sp. 6x1 TaxID=3042689 RepID=UPI002482BED2|nr:methyltransferase [Polyangium sp. 6x1]MDI1448162.1 methyltransferase [Polyangium sp. 6x1]
MSHAVGVAAKLGFAELLASGPRSVEDLARTTNAHAPSVYRLLRLLASRGIFREEDPGIFVNTAMSNALRDPSTIERALLLNHATHVRAWSELEHSVRTGENGFEKAFGMGFWEYTAHNPEFAGVFSRAMSGYSREDAPLIVESYDFHGIETVVDVGGGHGLLLATILAKNPHLQGVLFDLPHVVEGAPAVLEEKGVRDRCEIVGGSFFDRAPAGDLYLLKHILHDWSDERSIEILRTIHAASKPSSKVLIVELVVASGNEPSFAKLLDLEMLVQTAGGRERTAAEYGRLYEAAGFELERVWPTPGPVVLIEGKRRS